MAELVFDHVGFDLVHLNAIAEKSKIGMRVIAEDRVMNRYHPIMIFNLFGGVRPFDLPFHHRCDGNTHHTVFDIPSQIGRNAIP